MNPARILAALAVLSLSTTAVRAEDEATLDRLNLGTYWYGAEISKKDLLGKVVLVEIYGS